MKKTRTISRRSKVALRDRATRIDELLSLHAINAKLPAGIHIPAAASHLDGCRKQATAGNLPSASAAVLEDLSRALGQVTAATHARTFKLLQSGRRKLARKLIEEACEVTVEAVKRDQDGVVRESADLLYHLVVLWFHIGVEPIDVWEEMQARADALGIAEKLPKPAGEFIARDKLNR
jgi:phosphoribosyl-ATP pyrophosphohydrolase